MDDTATRAQAAAAGTATQSASSTAPEGAVHDLADPELYTNRELSWLDFNDRVLQLAEDEHLPLMERVKFLAIFVTNLDEFFMVRVAGLHDQIDARIDARGPDGLSPSARFRESPGRWRSLTAATPETSPTRSARRWPSRASGS